MPLDREHVTTASRIMLPTYVVFFAGVGLNWLVTPRDRLVASPGLAYADHLISIRGWGVLYLAAALLMGAALWRGQRTWFRFALRACRNLTILWGLMLIAATLFGEASPSSCLWPGLVAAACEASYRSLTRGEV